MKKKIIVILLTVCLLIAGCSETEPTVNITEASENSTHSSVLNIDENQNGVIEEVPELNQGQSSVASNRFVGSTYIINPRTFIEMSGGLPTRIGPTGFDFRLDGWGRTYLPYEHAKEFILGIDFSQLEFIGETDVPVTGVGPGLPEPPPGAKPSIIVFENYLECALRLSRSRNTAIFEVFVIIPDPDNNRNFFTESTSYEYFMSDEFFDAVWERLEGFMQYAYTGEITIDIEEL